jgi:2-polyprenyl-6-methoxyphenol hydroxylase-like FAD-dependent oxidoreductase
MTSDQTAVIIAGAGPVGLGLACELGLRGIDCLLVEKRDGSISVPKMSMVSARSMEACRRWGVAEEVRGAVWPESHSYDFVYMESLRGREIVRVKIPAYAQRGKLDFTPEGARHCPQIYFDPILTRRVRSMPAVALRYDTRLDAFSQDDDGVTARLTDVATGAARTVRARYLVGCDGPAGIVRETLGIELGGLGVVANSVNIFFRSPQLATLHDKGWARFYRPVDESGCWAELIPIDGKELWRLTVFDDRAAAADPDARLRRVAGGDFPYEILSVTAWERRDHVAQRYGDGRVFIAGDAAHECSPTGGFGMHTGLEEAVNLGWKLAAVIEGWGGLDLLASYETERRPIALRNVELATRAYRSVAAIPGWRDGREIANDRAADPAHLVHLAQWRTDPGRLSPREHVKVQYCYEQSPICVPDGDAVPDWDPQHYVPSTRPGTRAPHAWLADGRSVLDLFGDGFVLLRLGDDPPDAAALLAAAKAQGTPMREHALPDPAIAAVYERRLVLVRPDGHVAWRGDESPADPHGIIARVRGAADMQSRRPDTRVLHAASQAPG